MLHTTVRTLIPAALLLLLTAFTPQQTIPECFLSFHNADHLKYSGTERLPASAEKTRTIKSNTGEATITCIDGYRIRYQNKKNVDFVNIKVELSDPASYAADTTALIAYLDYLHANSKNMEGTSPVHLRYNGYTIHGISRNTLENVNTLGTFIMFPGNNITVYFYFNNLAADVRHYETVEGYKSLRNSFIGRYTNHLKLCGTR